MQEIMIQGKLYPEGAAASQPAQLVVESHFFQLLVNGEVVESGTLFDLVVSDRVGHIERKITLLSGSVFTSDDNDSIDRALKTNRSVSGVVHRIEGNLLWVLVAVIVTVIAAFSFIKWGVPWTSEKIAHALPAETNQLISGETLAFLDEHLFDETTIPEDQRKQIRQHFFDQVVPLETDQNFQFKLHFRAWNFGKTEVPNALALPSGDIILTDKFVELCENQQEMDSVLLHEMGHVVHRHGLTNIIQSTMISIVFVTVFGDASAMGDIALGLGGVLISSAYSREHETEADVYAFNKMLQARIDPANFATIMARITSDHDSHDTHGDQERSDMKESSMDYFSTHPNTDSRIELANKYSQCFKEQKLTCE